MLKSADKIDKLKSLYAKGKFMQKGHLLQFNCQSCKNPLQFSVLDLDRPNHLLECTHCHKKYRFDDDTLKRQLKKFANLCKQIHESEEILGNTSVGVDVGGHQIKIPYKLLLTRLNSTLDLMIGNEPLSIIFRIEPIKDLSSQTISS